MPAPAGPYELIAAAAGGLALFLLAMRMMTGGLRLFAGSALRRLLAGWTSTPLRGVATGALVTGAVQSSSAVTVATIGFVNAGVLSLPQALGVVYGANVGTTVTSWLVSLIGLDFKIQVLALPLIAVGTVMLIATPTDRLRGLGEALAGFGLFFLGLTILRDGLAGLAGALDVTAVALAGVPGILAFVAIGFVTTLLVQSSSAAIALILTSAGAGVVGLEPAAAAVIGANLGTTSTAAFAAIGATPDARRVALGHIAFNLIAGAVALALLVPLLWLVGAVGGALGLAVTVTVALALFHTAVKLLGLVVILPLTGRLTRWLSGRFRTAAEEASRPRHLDDNVLAAPPLALAALALELRRMHARTTSLARTALSGEGARPGTGLVRDADSVVALGQAVAAFVTRLDMKDLPHEVADALPRMLRISRYLMEGARLAPRMAEAMDAGARLGDAEPRAAVARLRDLAARTLAPEGTEAEDASAAAANGAAPDPYDDFERAYQAAKLALLRAGAARTVDIETLDRVLTALSQGRRMIEQIVKAARLLGPAEEAAKAADAA